MIMYRSKILNVMILIFIMEYDQRLAEYEKL